MNMVSVGSAVAFLTLDTSKYTNGLKVAKGHMNRFMDDSSESTKRIEGLGNALGSAGTTMAMGVTLPLLAIGTLSTKIAMESETAFTGIVKTTEGTEEQFVQLRGEIDKLADTVPVAVGELYEIGAIGGQLGIARDDIADFTEVMANMGIATNMSAEQASTSMARMANIMGMASEDYSRLGSTIVDLGNNLATTEAEITEMGLRLAGTGSQIGLTEAQVLSFAGAMSSVGIQAEAGGSSMSRVWQKINTEVISGGEDLGAFAAIAGTTAQDFASTWGADPAQAIEDFVAGLGRIEASGGDVAGALKEVGIASITEIDTLSRLSGASDLLSESLERGTKAWEEDIALTKEAETRGKDTAMQLQLMKNQFVFLAEAIGSVLLPPLTFFMGIIGKVVGALAGMNKGVFTVIVGFGALVASIGPVLLGLGFLVKAHTTVTKAMDIYRNSEILKTLATKAWTVIAPIATAVTGSLSVAFHSLTFPITAVIALVLAVVAAITWLYKRFKRDKEAIVDEADDLTTQLNNSLDAVKNPESAKDAYTELGIDITDGLADGIDAGVDTPVDAMKDMNKKMIDEATKTKDEMSKTMEESVRSLDKFGDAIMSALKKKYDAMEKDQLKHLDRKIENEKGNSDKLIDIIQRMSDREVAILDRNLDNLKYNTDQRIDEYQREYDERIKLLDIETDAAVSGIQGEIDAIDAITAKEEKAIEEREYRQRLSNLQQQKSNAETAEERARIENDINRLVADRERKMLLESRKEQKDSLREQAQALKDAAAEKKEIMKTEFEEQKAEAQESFEIQKERISAEIELIKAHAAANIEIEKQRISTVVDGLNLERDAVREHYAELKEQENIFAESRKMIVEGNNDEIVDLLNTYNPKWQDAGQSMADSLVNGLNSEKESVAAAVSNSLNIAPEIKKQEEAIEALTNKIEMLKKADEEALPETTKGLEKGTKATKDTITEQGKLDKSLKDTGKALDTNNEEWDAWGNRIITATQTGVNGMNRDLSSGLNDGTVMLGKWSETSQRDMNDAWATIGSNAEISGSNAVVGFMNGLQDKWNRSKRFMKDLANDISMVFDGAMEINSPSRLFYRKGEYTVDGYVDGIDSSIPKAEAKTLELAKAADVDYTNVINRPQGVDIGARETQQSNQAINKLIEIMSKPQGNSSPQDIVLNVGGTELARTTIDSIRDYEKQTGRVVLG